MLAMAIRDAAPAVRIALESRLAPDDSAASSWQGRSPAECPNAAALSHVCLPEAIATLPTPNRGAMGAAGLRR
jgi:hypothetical protein